FKQVFKVLEKLGFEQAKDCFHLKYNFVELPDGAMSSRKGNIVPLLDLVHRMEDTVKTNFLSRYENEWSADEVKLVAEQVAKGAIKFGMVRMDTNKKIVFDMNEWLKLEGESGPFVQYSLARIQSLVRKLGAPPVTVRWELLQDSAERKLMAGLMNFHSIVLGSAENYKPHLLTTYLYETAKRFNLFYHECSIGQAQTEDLKQARLALSEATGLVLKKGLEILGIPAPDRM
ncbi:MAG: arginine--tRNA ligase domain-containing protein, partial [Pseudobdellovibrionaceae bacterium]